jgi:hypothetical protein
MSEFIEEVFLEIFVYEESLLVKKRFASRISSVLKVFFLREGVPSKDIEAPI